MGQWKAFKKSSGTGWKELEHEAGSGWKALLWETGYEDFTTFTEVDIGADRIQKTANHVDWYADCDETTYLYKDYGAGHFGDFTHKIKIKTPSIENSSHGYFWALANEVNTVNNWFGGTDKAISMFVTRVGGANHMYLREFYNGNVYQDTWSSFSAVTWYYIKIVKSGTSLNAYIYSDSGYSVLVDTLTVTLQANVTYRYLYACNVYVTSGAVAVFDIENFDLG